MVNRYSSIELHDDLATESGAASASDVGANLAALSSLMASVKKRLAAMQAHAQSPLESIVVEQRPSLDSSPAAPTPPTGQHRRGQTVSSTVFEQTDLNNSFRSRGPSRAFSSLNRASRRILGHSASMIPGELDANAQSAVEGGADFA